MMKKIVSVLAVCFLISSFIAVSGFKGNAYAEEGESVYTESEEGAAEQTHEGMHASDEQTKNTAEEAVEGDLGGEPSHEVEHDSGYDW